MLRDSGFAFRITRLLKGPYGSKYHILCSRAPALHIRTFAGLHDRILMPPSFNKTKPNHRMSNISTYRSSNYSDPKWRRDVVASSRIQPSGASILLTSLMHVQIGSRSSFFSCSGNKSFISHMQELRIESAKLFGEGLDHELSAAAPVCQQSMESVSGRTCMHRCEPCAHWS